MSTSASPQVAQLVARFLEARRSGLRPELDQFLPTPSDGSDLARTRREALTEIARIARSTVLQGGSDLAGRSSGRPADPRGASLSVSEEMPQIEGYFVIDLIGFGGMGAVYEAYQESTGRRVALKLMLSHVAGSESARRRFEREVELIARLQHPAIVSILDSGVKRGRYYYVMEYIEGEPLDRSLGRGRADWRIVLATLAEICEAVDYAHQRGVMHRDLKPGNILIDTEGRPRILDFGLAKAIEERANGSFQKSLSEAGQVLGTVGYMSPEQARGQVEQLTVRSDVYSLGAIGYELIAGRLPFAVDGALSDVLRRIEEAEPPPPAPARLRQGRDINAILLKALEKRPASRYATAGDLAADLRGVLEDRPIMARPIGPLMRTWRWLRRHRAVATATGVGLAMVLVVGGVLGSWWLESRAGWLESRSEVSRKDLFWSGVLREANPNQSGGVATATEHALDYAAAQVEQELGRYPADIADVQHEIGTLYRHLRSHEKAIALLESALARRITLFGEQDERVADSKYELACALHLNAADTAALERVKSLLLSTLEVGGRRGGDPARRAATLNRLGWVYTDDGVYDEALRYYEEARRLRLELDDPGALGETLADMGYYYHRLDRLAQAIPYFRQAIPLLEQANGHVHEHTAAALNGLGSVLRRMGEWEESGRLLREALELRIALLGTDRRKGGTDRHDVLISRNELGLLLLESCDYEGALAQLMQVLVEREQLYPATHELVLVSLINVAQALSGSGRPADALPYYERAYQAAVSRYSDYATHSNTASIYHHRAVACFGLGQLEEAEQLARQALGIRVQRARNAATIGVAESQWLLGIIAAERQAWDEAESWLRQALEVRRRLELPAHWRTARIEISLARALLELGQIEEAAALLFPAIERVRTSPCYAIPSVGGTAEQAVARLAELSEAAAAAESDRR